MIERTEHRVERPVAEILGEGILFRGVALLVGEEVALHDIGVMLLGEIVQFLEHLGGGEIVGLDDADVFSACKAEALVHGVAVARVGLVDDLDAVVHLRVLVKNGGGGVGGAVVEADDLDVLERLSHEAVKALPQIALNVADGYEDANFAGDGHVISSKRIVYYAREV